MSAAGAVAPAAAAGAPGAPGAPAPAAAGGWSLSSLLRMLMMYYVVSSFMGRNKTPADVKDVATGVVHRPHRNAWPENTPYSLYVFVHDEADLNVAQHTAATLHPRSLIWFESGLKYGWEEGAATERALNWSMTADSWPLQHLHANGTLYAHTFFVRDHTPLFPYRAKGDVAGEEAYTHTHDALVVGSAGTALSSPSGAAPALVPIPSATSASFADAFVPNPGFDARNIIHRTMVLNIYRPAPKVVDKKNLLGVGGVKANSTELEVQLEPAKEAAVAGDAGIDAVAIDPEDEDEFEDLFDEDEQGNGVARRKGGPVRGAGPKGKAAPGKLWLSYWKPFLHIRLIPDWTVFPYGGIPAEMTDDYVLNPATDAYDPPVYFDYFWLLQDQLTIVNSTVSHLSLNLSHTPLSLLKWRLETQMETSWKMQQNWGMQEEDGRDSEMFKKMVMDTNIYLLAITFVVSILHAVFDFLAFKNDVKFWYVLCSVVSCRAVPCAPRMQDRVQGGAGTDPKQGPLQLIYLFPFFTHSFTLLPRFRVCVSLRVCLCVCVCVCPVMQEGGEEHARPVDAQHPSQLRVSDHHIFLSARQRHELHDPAVVGRGHRHRDLEGAEGNDHPLRPRRTIPAHQTAVQDRQRGEEGGGEDRRREGDGAARKV